MPDSALKPKPPSPARKYLTGAVLATVVIALYVSAFWRFTSMHGSP